MRAAVLERAGWWLARASRARRLLAQTTGKYPWLVFAIFRGYRHFGLHPEYAVTALQKPREHTFAATRAEQTLRQLCKQALMRKDGLETGGPEPASGRTTPKVNDLLAGDEPLTLSCNCLSIPHTVGYWMS